MQNREWKIAKIHHAELKRIASDPIQAGVRIGSIAIEEGFDEIAVRYCPVLAGVGLVRMLNRYLMDIVQSEWEAINVRRW